MKCGAVLPPAAQPYQYNQKPEHLVEQMAFHYIFI